MRDGSALAQFLQRELHQTGTTTIEQAVVKLRLPEGVGLVKAFGVSTEGSSGRDLILNVGTLYAGEERRMILELSADLEHDRTASITSVIGWKTVGGAHAKTKLEPVSLTGERDANKVAASRDSRVFAGAVSVTASARQLEASQAFVRGDKAKADSLIAGSVAELEDAAKAAPTAVARRLYRQRDAYQKDGASIAQAKPSSATAKSIAKRTYQKNLDNMKAASF